MHSVVIGDCFMAAFGGYSNFYLAISFYFIPNFHIPRLGLCLQQNDTINRNLRDPYFLLLTKTPLEAGCEQFTVVFLLSLLISSIFLLQLVVCFAFIKLLLTPTD
ncbi:hypothetical protein BOTBODRAFT_42754 [Botryobasidium botryosum FD-172 SS1]|uniref:Uncharacterized protein n=1 Tax=Botryobasidium botryosum (strain FD-172 SS1) TaxID=930990 RepID=A0A067MPF4_BOTB1|nr:hypothetical protein BOTBODRAFT_42754 [Botryobasidium botryosum FD-172 SS1]